VRDVLGSESFGVHEAFPGEIAVQLVDEEPGDRICRFVLGDRRRGVLPAQPRDCVG
jgi:hypothetical protein